MTALNDVRSAVISAFKTVHDAHAPTVKVNYPNLVVVDIEHQTDPFVTLSLDTQGITRAALGETELLVPGFLFVYYYFLENTGTASAYSYTDMLNTYLCMRQVGSIAYGPARPIMIETFPGWKGFMNSIKFDVCRVCG